MLKQKKQMKINVSWALYIIGSLLVFGSWVQIVPTGLGWIGWLMALVGWAIGNSARQPQVVVRPVPSKMDELNKLHILHKEGVVSDEEFEAEKERLLKQS